MTQPKRKKGNTRKLPATTVKSISHKMAEVVNDEEDPASNHIFSWGMKIHYITPSTPAIIDISRLMYRELSDERMIKNMVLPEYIDYYCTAMVWFRIVSLKRKLFQNTTSCESRLLLLLEQKQFAIPEPLFMQLKVLGSVQISTEKHLYPSFPDLPTKKVAFYGGYYGPINEETHNLYEEIPCLGVLAEAVRQSVSDTRPGPYTSALNTEDTVPNANLLGYLPLGRCQPEAKEFASSCNITAENFPESPSNTGINMDLLSRISTVLSQTTTFTVETVNFKALSTSGSIIQTTIQKNSQLVGTLEKKENLIVTSHIDEKSTVIGAAIMFSPQLWKSDKDAKYVNSSWACIENVPQSFIENRNKRRIASEDYNEDYKSCSQNAHQFRTIIIKKMRKNNFHSEENSH